jgi:hypothetical protein
LIPVRTGTTILNDRYSLPVNSSWTDPGESFTVRTIDINASLDKATIEIVISKAAKGCQITSHPRNTSYVPGGGLTLHSEGKCVPAAATQVQWQRFNSASGQWANVQGANQKSYSIDTYFGDGNDGSVYRVVYSSEGQTSTSTAASITTEPDGKPMFLAPFPKITTRAEDPFNIVAGVLGAPLLDHWLGPGRVAYTLSLGPNATGNLIVNTDSSPEETVYSAQATNGHGTTGISGVLEIVDYQVCNATVYPAVIERPAGESVTLTLQSGHPSACTGASVVWQSRIQGGAWSNIPAAAGQWSYNRVAAEDDHLRQFRAVLSVGGISAETNASTILVPDSCAITEQPESVDGSSGVTRMFSVGTTEGCSGYSIAWQKMVAGGGLWQTIPEATGTTYSTVLHAADQGTAIRAILTSGARTVRSAAAVVDITYCYRVTPTAGAPRQAGETVELVGATGSGCATWWERSNDRGATWTWVADGMAYEHSVVPGENGVRIRAVHRLTSGAYRYSEPAVLHTAECKDLSGVSEEIVADSAGAIQVVGTNACWYYYKQWQESSDFGQTWTSIAGKHDNLLTLTGLTAADDLKYIRLVRSFGDVEIAGKPRIIRVPNSDCSLVKGFESQNAGLGEGIRMTAYATTGCAEWERRVEKRNLGGAAGTYGPWEEVLSNEAGATYANGQNTGSIFGFSTGPIVSRSYNGMQFRTVLVSDTGVTIVSEPATFTIRTGCDFEPMAALSSQMKAIGETLELSIDTNSYCNGSNSMLMWSESTDGGASWVSTESYPYGEVYTETVDWTDYGTLYVAMLNTGGREILSEPAVLIVASEGAPVVTRQATPAGDFVPVGTATSIVANAMGQEEPTVQWQREEAGGWEDILGEVSPTLHLTPAVAGESGSFRAVFTNSLGSTASEAAWFYAYEPVVFTQTNFARTVASGTWASIPAPTFTSGVARNVWERSDDDGLTWYEIEGTEGYGHDNYEFIAEYSDNGSLFRVAAKTELLMPAVYCEEVILYVV